MVARIDPRLPKNQQKAVPTNSAISESSPYVSANFLTAGITAFKTRDSLSTGAGVLPRGRPTEGL